MHLRWTSLLSLMLPGLMFADAPDLLINAQGLAQQDYSIRGSSYNGAGISINGLNLKVPYSSHYNADHPLFGPLLADTKTLSGTDNVSGHLIGTSAMNVLPLEQRSAINIGMGTAERYRGTVNSSTEKIGVFIDSEKALGIDYDANNLERVGGGTAVQLFRNDWQFDLLAGVQHKDYGAQGYYGIPANVYAEEQTDDVLMLATASKGDLDGAYMRTGFSLRRYDSDYAIPTANFTSDVRSRYGSLMLEGRTLEIQNIALNLRGDIEHERIDGDIGEHGRTRGSVLIIPEFRFERFQVKAGLNSVYQTDETPEWLPQAGVDFLMTDNSVLYASYSESVMQPDFKNLYYADPYHLGNIELQLQHSHSTELGLRQFLSSRLDWRTAIFQRHQENAMDWVKSSPADTTWSATDLGSLDVSGIDVKVNYLASDQLKIQLYYQWIEKDKYEIFAGLYQLDYPEHLMSVSGYWQLRPELQLFSSQTMRKQTANNARSGSDFGVEGSIGLLYDPHFAKNVRLSLLVENMWGTNFQAIPGLDPRPTSVSTGITVTW